MSTTPGQISSCSDLSDICGKLAAIFAATLIRGPSLIIQADSSSAKEPKASVFLLEIRGNSSSSKAPFNKSPFKVSCYALHIVVD